MTERAHTWRTRLALVFWILIVIALVCWPAAFVLAAERPTATPVATADQWLNDPDGSLRAILTLAGSLVQAVQTISLTGWLLGAAGLAVGILRFTPAWGPIIGWCWDSFLAPRKDVAAERAQAIQAQGFQVLVKQIENLPTSSTLGDLRDKLARKMPEKVKDAVEQYLDQHGRALHVASQPWPFEGVEGVRIKSDAPLDHSAVPTELPKA